MVKVNESGSPERFHTYPISLLIRAIARSLGELLTDVGMVWTLQYVRWCIEDLSLTASNTTVTPKRKTFQPQEEAVHLVVERAFLLVMDTASGCPLGWAGGVVSARQARRCRLSGAQLLPLSWAVEAVQQAVTRHNYRQPLASS